jgi:ABC-2 type transport system permease protein
VIPTLLRIAWLNLKRDYVALGLTFVLPIVFFSIFAMIFGGMATGGGTGASAMRVIVVDEDDTEVSRRYVEAIDAQDALRVFTAPTPAEENPEPAPFDRDTAKLRVRTGAVPVAIVIPEDFGESFGSFAGDGEPVELIYDSANPIAQHTVSGLLQAAAMTAAPDILMESGLEQLATFGGGLTPEQQEAVDFIKPYLAGEKPWGDLEEDEDTPAGADGGAGTTSSGDDTALGGFSGLVTVTGTPARADEEDDDPPNMVAYYAAGIGVMFLLFSMAGAGGSLLEEEEYGTLERVLSTRVTMTTLLLSYWLFFAIVGMAQIGIMFLWGELVFGLELWTVNHLVGFALMTIVTATAAAAFGIVLATLCRSRAQLSGMSTIVILVMSALGGSMVPRFVMSDFMNNVVSKFTFNGWALDGYMNVFWTDLPDATLAESVIHILPQVGVLVAITIVMLALARLLARRWTVA